MLNTTRSKVLPENEPCQIIEQTYDSEQLDDWMDQVFDVDSLDEMAFFDIGLLRNDLTKDYKIINP